MSQEGQDRPESVLEQAQLRLQAWRREGVWRVDPLRFVQLEALARRAQAQAEPVRQRLECRLAALMDDHAARIEQARHAVATQAAGLVAEMPALARPLRLLQASGDLRGLQRLATRMAPRSSDALAALHRHAQQVSPTVRGALAAEVEAGREELSSVRAFRRVWGRRQSLDRLALARARQPANAGPLNSHVLVLQSLELMQALSPDYLRHFMAHVEALQWLEQARDARPEAAPAKTGKAATRRKKG